MSQKQDCGQAEQAGCDRVTPVSCFGHEDGGWCVVAPRPKWWHTLQEARRQACLAIDFYNRPGDKRSFYDFVVHSHLAWQNLLHADLARRKINIFQKLPNGRYVRGKDGERRSWSLQECLKHEFTDNDPIRANVEFFIGLRNKIEHRFQDAFLVATAAHAHALVINFETELVSRFSGSETLAHELRFPVFVQSLTPEGVAELRKQRQKLPAAARTYITKFEARLDAATRDDQRFVYRVQLTPMKGPRTAADMAITFTNIHDMTDEQLAKASEAMRSGAGIIIEKPRDVPLKDEMLPTQAAAAIEARLPYEFKVHHFTMLRKLHDVQPAPGESVAPENSDFCVYVPHFKRYMFTPAYVDRCVNEIDTREKFERVLGQEPQQKITHLAAKGSGQGTGTATAKVGAQPA